MKLIKFESSETRRLLANISRYTQENGFTHNKEIYIDLTKPEERSAILKGLEFTTGTEFCCIFAVGMGLLDRSDGLSRSQIREILTSLGFYESWDPRSIIQNDIDIPNFIKESLIVVCRKVDSNLKVPSPDDFACSSRVVGMLDEIEKITMIHERHNSESVFIKISPQRILIKILYKSYLKNRKILFPIWTKLPLRLKKRIRTAVSKRFN